MQHPPGAGGGTRKKGGGTQPGGGKERCGSAASVAPPPGRSAKRGPRRVSPPELRALGGVHALGPHPYARGGGGAGGAQLLMARAARPTRSVKGTRGAAHPQSAPRCGTARLIHGAGRPSTVYHLRGERKNARRGKGGKRQNAGVQPAWPLRPVARPSAARARSLRRSYARSAVCMYWGPHPYARVWGAPQGRGDLEAQARPVPPIGPSPAGAQRGPFMGRGGGT